MPVSSKPLKPAMTTTRIEVIKTPGIPRDAYRSMPNHFNDLEDAQDFISELQTSLSSIQIGIEMAKEEFDLTGDESSKDHLVRAITAKKYAKYHLLIAQTSLGLSDGENGVELPTGTADTAQVVALRKKITALTNRVENLEQRLAAPERKQQRLIAHETVRAEHFRKFVLRALYELSNRRIVWLREQVSFVGGCVESSEDWGSSPNPPRKSEIQKVVALKKAQA